MIDALMFVFGKKAKKIRLSKLSELIHNPQKGGQKPSFARVDVIFHEIIDLAPGEYEIVAGSELVVAREVASNNNSKYVVNGKSSNWTEVTALFSSKGIDLERNRFLILQGEVEQIAMMKPKGENVHEEGLLEYLEDLIGSNQFIESIEEKSKNFTELSEQRNEHVHRVKQAEKEKDALEGPRQEAELYVKAASDLLEAKCLLAMLQRFQIDQKVQTARSEINEAALQLDRVAEEIQAETAKAKDLEASFQQRKKEKEESKIASEKASAEFAEHDKLDAGVNAKIRLTQASIAKEQKEAETEQKTVEKLRGDMQELVEKIMPEVEKQINVLKGQFGGENAILDELYDAVEATTRDLKHKLGRMEIEASTIQSDINKVVGDQKLLAAERDVLLQKEKSGEELKAKTETMIKQLQDQLASRLSELSEAESTKSVYAKKLSDTIRQLSEMAREYELALNASTAAKQRLEAAKSDAVTDGKPSMHTRIMKEVEKGKLKGVYGRLADLGSVDAKLETAFAVAMSSQAESVVVGTSADAQSVIAFVKQNNLGRVTCVILESVNMTDEGLNMSLPRMVDLITVAKPDLKKAFWFAMRATLLADDIRTATKIGNGRRVVTVSGEVIEPTGAMTGGGSAASLTAGRNKQKQAEQAEKELGIAQSEFEKASVRFENARNAKSALVSERDALERSLEQFDTVIANREEIDQLKEQLAAEQARVGGIVIPKLSLEEHEHVRRISAEIEAIQQSMQPKLAELEAVTAAKEKLAKEITAKAGEKTNKQKAIVDALKAEFDAKEKELERNKLERNKIGMKMDKGTKKIVACSEEIERLQKQLDSDREELVRIETRAGELLKEFTGFRELTAKIEQELLGLEKEFNAFKAKIVEMKKKHTEVLNEINKLEDVKSELEAKSREFSKQINSIRKEFKALPHELVELNDEEKEERARMAALNGNAMQIDSDEKPSALKTDLPAADLEKLSPPEVQTTLVRLEARMTKLHPNLKAIEDYRQKLKEFKHKVRELEQLNAKRDEVRKALEFLRQERLSMFMAGFNTITLKVKEMYQMLTLGGDAELELVDTTDPFAKGISFSVRPPKKTWKAITQLSGGEKTLSSLSLVFALHYFKPTPLYFLDEIDAALDTRNVAIIANYIKQRATNAQFIIISLRNQMFELADWLVGIYKTEHVSKSVTLDPAAASAGLGAFKPQEARPFYASPEKQRDELLA